MYSTNPSSVKTIQYCNSIHEYAYTETNTPNHCIQCATAYHESAANTTAIIPRKYS